MTEELLAIIGDADSELDDAAKLEQAIIDLSNNQAATSALLTALIKAEAKHEAYWQRAEQTDDFKRNYANRDDARADYLRIMVQRER